MKTKKKEKRAMGTVQQHFQSEKRGTRRQIQQSVWFIPSFYEVYKKLAILYFSYVFIELCTHLHYVF